MVKQAIRCLEKKEEDEIREVKKDKEKKTATEMVPPQFHIYLDQFEKKTLYRRNKNYTLYHQPRLKKLVVLLMNNYERDTSDLRNH